MTALSSGLARKIKKTLETRTETPEFLSSLDTLSEFYMDNTAPERRRLRSTIEQQGLRANEEFLAAAEMVIGALDTVDTDLDHLSAACRRVSSALATGKAQTAGMRAEARRLRGALEASEQRLGLVQQFRQQYQLSHDEVYALQEGLIEERFFEALERVRVIHGNCRALLRGSHQRAGLELMDDMSSHQEKAYERLCRWVQVECRGLGEADAPEVDPLLQRAAAALRARPVLFQYCAEEVAAARHGALFQRFIAALTRGGPGGTPRPIEMHAHDPRRYVGDMLAWVHQSLASERELLVALFGDDGGPPLEGASAAEMPHTAELLDRVFESICKPLKVRIEQVLASGPPLLLCFRLAQLLGFYADTVAQLAGPAAALVSSLQSSQAAAGRSFREQLTARAERLARHPPPPPSNLSPPPQVAEGISQLLEVITAFEGTYQGGDAAPPEGAAAEFEVVLAAAVDPLVDMCERSAEALKADAPSKMEEGLHLTPAARRMYLINCLAALQAPIAPHASAAGRAAALGQGVEAHLAGLAADHVEALLHKSSRMDDVLGRVHFYQGGKVGEGTVMAADPALALQRIQEAARAFIATVSDPTALPEFEQLLVPRLKADAAARVVRSLADAYEAVWQAVADPQNGYLAAGEANPLQHTPEHVRTILGVVT